jgi:hypothetical protein
MRRVFTQLMPELVGIVGIVAEFAGIAGIVAEFVVAVQIVVEEYMTEFEPPLGKPPIALEARIQRGKTCLSGALGTR